MIRVVCNNTLTFALHEEGEEFGRFAHTRNVHAHIRLAKGYVKAALDTQRDFKKKMESLITTSITDSAARTLLSRTLQSQSDGKKMGRILRLFHGDQRGADLTTIDGTAWASWMLSRNTSTTRRVGVRMRVCARPGSVGVRNLNS